MGRGTYIGGHTVFGPGSDWFSYSDPPNRKRRKKGKRQVVKAEPKKPSKREPRLEVGDARRAAIAAGSPERAAAREAQKAKLPGSNRRPKKTPTFTVERKRITGRPTIPKPSTGKGSVNGDQD